MPVETRKNDDFDDEKEPTTKSDEKNLINHDRRKNVISNQYKALQRLLKKGADVNTTNELGETCMIRP